MKLYSHYDMMNAELSACGQQRIMIPTVYRDDYLLTLRRLSRENDAEPYIRMLERARLFSASIDYDIYATALSQLQASQAFKESNESKLIIRK